MTKEQQTRLDELNRILIYCDADEFEALYAEYQQLTEIQHKEYYERNYDDIHAYYLEHIANKSWDEINPDCWDFYSDWHKDVFGYRPRSNSFNERGA